MTRRIEIKLTPAIKAAIREVAKRAWPEWKGRKIRLVASYDYPTPDYWGSESRCYYAVVKLRTGAHWEANAIVTSEAHPAVTIPDGWAVLEHTVFRGQDAGVTLYIPDAPSETLAAIADMPARFSQHKRQLRSAPNDESTHFRALTS